MIKVKEVVYDKNDSKKMFRVMEVLSSGYYNVVNYGEEIGSKPFPIHESAISKDNPNFSPLEINYGDGKFFTDKLLMACLFLFITIGYDEDFKGFNYIDDKSFKTRLSDKDSLFIIEEVDYNGDFFRWSDKTFKSNADFTIQIGIDYIRIFNNTEVYDRLSHNILNNDGKLHFAFVRDGVHQSGAISSNPDNTKFGCRNDLISDKVWNSEITKDHKK